MVRDLCSCGYDGVQSHCHTCHATGIPAAGIADHIRGHAGLLLRVECWPDGSPVVVDSTLEPADFGGAQDGGG